jgi:hypothetical protein
MHLLTEEKINHADVHLTISARPLIGNRTALSPELVGWPKSGENDSKHSSQYGRQPRNGLTTMTAKDHIRDSSQACNAFIPGRISSSTPFSRQHSLNDPSTKSFDNLHFLDFQDPSMCLGEKQPVHRQRRLAPSRQQRHGDRGCDHGQHGDAYITAGLASGSGRISASCAPVKSTVTGPA